MRTVDWTSYCCFCSFDFITAFLTFFEVVCCIYRQIYYVLLDFRVVRSFEGIVIVSELSLWLRDIFAQL